MKHLTTTKTKLLGAAALSALLLAAIPASATETNIDDRRRGNSFEISYSDNTRDSYRSHKQGKRYAQHRPLRVFVKFEGAKRQKRNPEFRAFKRQVKWQMQNRSDRRLIFVGNRHAADRVIRINKRQWKRDYRAYARGGYNPERRYFRYSERNDPVVQVAFAALEIAHILKHDKRRSDRIDRRQDRREDRRQDRRDDRRDDRRSRY